MQETPNFRVYVAAFIEMHGRHLRENKVWGMHR